MKSNEFACPRCGQLIRIITVDDEGKEIEGFNPKISRRFTNSLNKKKLVSVDEQAPRRVR